MNISAAIAEFLSQSETEQHPLTLLIEFLPPDSDFSSLTPERLRAFLSPWSIDHGLTPSTRGSAGSLQSDYEKLFESLAAFLGWAAATSGVDEAAGLSVIEELRAGLPQALEITSRLAKWQEERRGAFGFPEFLTSFEDGGRSAYDLDDAGEVAAVDNVFRLTRVAGREVEVEDLVTGHRIWPVLFPASVAEVLAEGFLLNLELVRRGGSWEISAAGQAYPPGTIL